MAICGLKVRMAPASTAMNGAKFQCCELPVPPTSTFPPTTESSRTLSSLSSFAPTETTAHDSSLSDIKGNHLSKLE